MFASCDSAAEELIGMKIADVPAWTRCRQREGEIEIAVVHRAVPADVQLMTTHQLVERGGIERISEQLQILLGRALAVQVVQETADRNVRDRDQAREADAEACGEFAPICLLKRVLIRWQAWPAGVEHKVQW